MSGAPQRWIWLDEAMVRASHEEQLAEHGGPGGVRDPNLLSSELARLQQLANYGTPGVADLAASYGFAIARNHPFADGNKRTAFVAVELFLDLNGFELTAGDADCVMTMLDLAAGKLAEGAYAKWIGQHLEALDQ